MKLFNEIRAKCCICSTPTNGERKIGDKYYCADHYEKKEEEQVNEIMRDNLRFIKKLTRTP